MHQTANIQIIPYRVVWVEEKCTQHRQQLRPTDTDTDTDTSISQNDTL